VLYFPEGINCGLGSGSKCFESKQISWLGQKAKDEGKSEKKLARH
jgi:hypothetical protein